MKHIKIFACALSVALLSGCIWGGVNPAPEAPGPSVRTSFPDNAFKEIPREYFDVCEKGGTVKTFKYTTRDNQTPGSPEFEKSALVYLPYGYDENDTKTRYNVLYLMHGGGDSPAWYFDGEGRNSRLKNVLDHQIANGEVKPVIICALSYYTQYSNDATKNCIDYHFELDKDVIPVFEKQYHTYANGDVSQESLDASRWHRAFGGFSMGACATWSVFEFCLGEMGYFIPMSGDCWAKGRGNSVESAKHLADTVVRNGKTARDFFIYSGCGRNDVAEPNMTPMINEMKKYPEIFKYCDNFKDGNLYQMVYERGGHDINSVLRVMYNGMPKMFD
jgi:endo-1,4-beta-xylanase